MPRCALCGVELEPLVRVPHTVYVKELYRAAGQGYCRHHVISTAVVAAGVITAIMAGCRFLGSQVPGNASHGR